jgi:hypothetical protein
MKDADKDIRDGVISFERWWPTMRSEVVEGLSQRDFPTMKEIEAFSKAVFMSGWIRRSNKKPAPKEWR